jgi:hypothetical protein
LNPVVVVHKVVSRAHSIDTSGRQSLLASR